MAARLNEGQHFDYIVVGSGAGGGPLAARLAEAGLTVLLLEAGGRDDGFNNQIPCWHPLATEDPGLRWDYYTRHYENDGFARLDSKFVPDKGGILYPRAGTLGGCTVHNAMITVYPHASDWDYIAHVTGDRSWRATEMRRFFEKLERCGYYPGSGLRGRLRRLRWALRLGRRNPGRRGFDGWLSTSVASPSLVFQDAALVRVVKSAAKQAVGEGVGDPFVRLYADFDPNDARVAEKSPEGIAITPMATQRGQRCSPRDRLLKAEVQKDSRLTILEHALATRVILEGNPPKAVGVEYMEGESLYRADPRAATEAAAPPRRTVMADREVVLCAGAFNTPQLLMLSGIGPAAELKRLQIPVRVDLPGVGSNLQDRYEVGVVTRVKEPFSIIKGATFKPPAEGETGDRFFQDFKLGKGVYTSNGAVIGVIKRSKPDRRNPDLYIFGLPGYFKGYYPGYSQTLGVKNDYFTWAILKAHTSNRAGTITLRSLDPRDPPVVNFRYFHEGDPGWNEDLESMVEGVLFARRMNKHIHELAVAEEIPGPQVETREQIREFVQKEAWGHHASCTCPIGSPSDPMAVLDSHFRVRGVQCLRVVDASIFPHIPGFFIVTAIYMASEKAAEIILKDQREAAPEVSLS
jgi:choline dehydrogenase